jgi:hypothetical protein
MAPTPRRSGPAPVIHEVLPEKSKSEAARLQAVTSDDHTDNASAVHEPTGDFLPSPESEKKTKDKTKKVDRVAPSGTALPELGLPGFLYKATVRTGFPHVVPIKRLTQRDRLLQEIDQTEKWIMALANVPGMSFSISDINTQGGSSKTIMSIYPWSAVARLTQMPVYVAPATANTKTARAALVAGVDPEQSLQISEFAKKAVRLDGFAQLDELVQRSKYGLRVIANDATNQVSIDSDFDNPDLLRVARVLEREARIRVWDHGNENVSLKQLGLEAARRSDILTFPATANHPASLFGLSETIADYMSDNTDADAFEATVPEWARFPTQVKTQSGLTVITRIDPKKHDPDDFMRYTKRVDGLGKDAGDLGFSGTFLTIPEDEYIGDTSPETIVCDLEAIRRETYLAFLVYASMVFVKVGRQRGFTLPEPSLRLVDLWQRRNWPQPNLRPRKVELLPEPETA